MLVTRLLVSVFCISELSNPGRVYNNRRDCTVCIMQSTSIHKIFGYVCLWWILLNNMVRHKEASTKKEVIHSTVDLLLVQYMLMNESEKATN